MTFSCPSLTEREEWTESFRILNSISSHSPQPPMEGKFLVTILIVCVCDTLCADTKHCYWQICIYPRVYWSVLFFSVCACVCARLCVSAHACVCVGVHTCECVFDCTKCIILCIFGDILGTNCYKLNTVMYCVCDWRVYDHSLGILLQTFSMC